MLELLTDEEINNIRLNKAPDILHKDMQSCCESIAQAQLDKTKAQLNKKLDSPDSDGWWWFSGKYETIQDDRWEEWSISKPELLYIEADDISNDVFGKGYDGYWVKAHVPEE